MHNKCWSENLKGKYFLEDLCFVGKIMLAFILKKTVGGCRLDSCGSDFG